MTDYIFILSGIPLPSLRSTSSTGTNKDNFQDNLATKQILTSNEFGREFNNTLLLGHLKKAFPSSIVEITNISLANYTTVIDQCISKASGGSFVFMNLCDGIETDGYPGVSVVQYLSLKRAPYTGSGPVFYTNSTSKTLLKNLMIESHVPTLPFVTLSHNPPLQEDIEKAKNIVGYPLIIKPSVSYGSMMISTKSVVDGPEQMISYLTETEALKDYKDEIFLESFLAGREFTVLCTGDERVGVRVYTAAERVFAPNLKEREKILTFDICWDGCDLNANTTGEFPAQPYWYEAAPIEFQDYLQDLAKKAYLSVNGTGYGRVDIRTRSPSSKDGYVLEVNANCGLAFGRMASSLGEILILSKVEPDEFCKEIIDYGSKRFKV